MMGIDFHQSLTIGNAMNVCGTDELIIADIESRAVIV
jgi:hypothetical protein